MEQKMENEMEIWRICRFFADDLLLSARTTSVETTQDLRVQFIKEAK